MIDIALEERLDDLDPLRHFREDAGSDEDSTIVPVQPPSVRNQTIQLEFTAAPDIGSVAIKLAVDASPGCGGIAWPAGEVSYILAVCGVNVCLNAPPWWCRSWQATSREAELLKAKTFLN